MAQSFIAEVIVDHQDLPLTPTIRNIPDLDVRVESQPVAHPESPSIFYSVSTPDFQRFEESISDDPTVGDWRILMQFADCRVYQVYPSSKAKFTTPKISELGIQILLIRNEERSWHFQLQAPDKESLGNYWKYCRDEEVQFSLEKLYSSGPRAMVADSDSLKAQLTPRQREVAHTVTRMGYYEQEGASAAEVADELGISRSTLSTHLRRIMAKVFYYIDDDEQDNDPPVG